jgi:chromosome segregation ATPase
VGKYQAKHKTFEATKKNDKLKEYREEIKTKNEIIRQLQREIKELKKNPHTAHEVHDKKETKTKPVNIKCSKCLSPDIKKLSLGLKGGYIVLCNACNHKEVVDK